MNFPKQILVLLVWVPILVQSQNPERCNGDNTRQCVDWANKGECKRNFVFMQNKCRKSCNLCSNFSTGRCDANSQCRTAEYCKQGRCVDNPCSRVQCPSTCQIIQGQAKCDPIPERCNGNNERRCAELARQGECVRNPDFMQTNCKKSCNLCNDVITGCSDNSQCGNAGICDGGRCVADPCASLQCGTNTRCVALRGGQVECQPIPECSDNSQCRNNGICDRGRCIVNPCSPSPCGTNNKCEVVRGEVQCRPLQEDLIFNRDISQGAGVTGNTQSINQAGANGGANQGSVAQEGNQNESDQGSNQEGGLSAVSKRCDDKLQCKDNELCEKGNCVSPCDLIECGQGANCIVINVRVPQCICPAKTSGDPFVQCAPIQENTINDKTQPKPGLERPVASVSGCKINSQCGNDNERCQSGRCVDPCVSVKCGEGAECQVSQRQGRCVCPAGTVGNPLEQCKPKAGNVASDTQKPASVTNTPASTSGTNPDILFPDDKAPGKGTRLQGCETDPDPGECRGAFPRYYFNKAKNQCDCFLFGGCDIEGVKFTWPTFEECLNKCVPENTTKGSGCKRVSVDEVKEFLEQQRRDRENNGR